MKSLAVTLSVILAIAATALSCGTGAGNPTIDGVLIQSNPLAGPNAAFRLRAPGPLSTRVAEALEKGLLQALFLDRKAFATVSSFSVFRVCNDTMIFKDSSGSAIPINGSTSSEVGRGLLDFSPTSTQPMTIGRLVIPPGTQISEVDITFAVVPTVCGGAAYSVEFDDGTGGGLHDLTQNAAFKFQYASGAFTVTGSSQDTITLLFGNIVNGMSSLGTGLNNSTIQTVNVGQAR